MAGKDFMTLFPTDPPMPPVRVLDVGASRIGGEAPPYYERLYDRGLAEVVGFEPNAAMFEELRSLENERRRFLPYALGDGTTKTLNICWAPGMTSVLEPDYDWLGHIQGFADWARVVRREEMPTRRLDDVDEIPGFDYVKIDTQGSEHEIIEHGRSKISGALVLHVELSFRPFYKGEPSFAEVDTLIRSLGFQLHAMIEISRRAFKPIIVGNSPMGGLNQVMQADCVYMRDVMTMPDMTAVELIKTAMVMHYVYGSYDVAAMVLGHVDTKIGGDFQGRYMREVLQAG